MKSATFSRRIKDDGQSIGLTIPKDIKTELRLSKGDHIIVTLAKIPNLKFPELIFDRNSGRFVEKKEEEKIKVTYDTGINYKKC